MVRRVKGLGKERRMKIDREDKKYKDRKRGGEMP